MRERLDRQEELLKENISLQKQLLAQSQAEEERKKSSSRADEEKGDAVSSSQVNVSRRASENVPSTDMNAEEETSIAAIVANSVGNSLGKNVDERVSGTEEEASHQELLQTLNDAIKECVVVSL